MHLSWLLVRLTQLLVHLTQPLVHLAWLLMHLSCPLWCIWLIICLSTLPSIQGIWLGF
ncbi:hypothetical protein Lalb_Chr19g0126651 [Lupinus albus]|uniref:Uncharacterized protein n=1 Tax=Lupinus albus TaxID=3870 RepID=A0A6A4NN69_LUPAL|nr:hypothetical protein Lalb_Chr19g0126651 [Lupinus albus]